MSSKQKPNHLQILCAIALALTLGACAGSSEKKETGSTATGSGDLAPLTDAAAIEGWASDAEAGISWSAPASWEVGPERPMRAATYFAAAAEGDETNAECRVNFFGADQGGDVAGNIARWASQMEVDGQEGVSPEPMVSEANQGGITLSIVELHGTYLERMGPMSPSSTRQTGYAMFAVIAQGPNGSVFFKMTGPQATMEAERENFRRMIGSIAPQSA